MHTVYPDSVQLPHICWYGFPIVSSGWKNLTVFLISSIGVLFEISFISIYLWFAPREKKGHIPMVCTKRKKEARYPNRISVSGYLRHDHINLMLYNPHPPHTQGICWKYWCIVCHADVRLPPCCCGEYY